MFFPFWYNNELVFYKQNGIDYRKILLDLTEINKGNQIDEDNFIWQYKKGIFNHSIPIKIKLNQDKITIQLRYFLSLFESNILFLSGVVFAFFFWLNHHNTLVFFSFLIGFFLWIMNTFRLNYHVRKQLENIGFYDNNIDRQYLWQKQKKWQEQDELCPACGEFLNPYSSKCTQCGLQIFKKNKEQNIFPTNTTTNLSIKINYKNK